MKISQIDSRLLTPEEELEIYGTRRVEIGRCFIAEDGHAYMQCEDMVLHVKDGIINSLHSGFLNSRIGSKELMDLDPTEFKDLINSQVKLLGLDKFMQTPSSKKVFVIQSRNRGPLAVTSDESKVEDLVEKQSKEEIGGRLWPSVYSKEFEIID